MDARCPARGAAQGTTGRGDKRGFVIRFSVGMELASIRLGERDQAGHGDLKEPDGGKLHPYWEPYYETSLISPSCGALRSTSGWATSIHTNQIRPIANKTTQ